ncbi:MAG TPA: hypothetical protein PK227_11835 [Thermomonas sp.]|nr:hypothetical protein [Thermomonas sp.]
MEWQRRESDRRSQLEQRNRELERQRRSHQYRYQQDYYRRWLAQQSRWNASRYDYYNDPYYSTAYNYRYSYGGRWYQTNSYGRDLLQQAIRDGYREGWYAGQADRNDRWRFDYQGNYGYMDGTYGYSGYHVGRNEYRYYFQQGFERGYRDGYYRRYQYGRYDNGVAVILPAILGAILNISRY